MDLFEMDDRHYLVVVDYYSRYLEVVRLQNQTTDAVIRALKVIWATHGVAMEVQSDGGPCFRSDQFQRFADACGFLHTKSSPRYPPANGAAERAVQTAKAMLRKTDDLQMALLAYRTTPIIDGYSPAQLLMGRQLRTTHSADRVFQPTTKDAEPTDRSSTRPPTQEPPGD
jgi:transposase InsO family protein